MGSCASNANRLGWKYRATAARRFYSSRANRLGWGYHATAATRSYSSIINRLEWGGRYRATATMGLCSSSANRLALYGHNRDLCIARQPVRVGVQRAATTSTIHRRDNRLGWGYVLPDNNATGVVYTTRGSRLGVNSSYIARQGCINARGLLAMQPQHIRTGASNYCAQCNTRSASRTTPPSIPASRARE